MTTISPASQVVFGLRSISPSTQVKLDCVVDVWKQFRDLSQEEKISLRLPQFETDWSDPGYYRKQAQKGGYDDKEFFHHIFHLRFLYHMVGVHKFNQVVERLINSLDELSRTLKFDFSSELLNGLLDDPKENSELWRTVHKSLSLLTIRLLSYDEPDGNKEVIAARHFDKCFLTKHLYSSHSGLQIEVGQNEQGIIWKDLEVPRGQCAIFGGYQLAKWSKGKYRPLGHRVVSRAPGKREAIVVFAPSFDAPRFPKDKRMQELMEEFDQH